MYINPFRNSTIFDFSKINIKTEDSKIQELPMRNNNQISGDDGSSMNCLFAELLMF